MKTIFQNDDFIIDYNEENNKYRVSYFEDNHFVDDCEFNGFMRHGEWIPIRTLEGAIEVKCTNCESNCIFGKVKINYCPNCGARMDGSK